MQVFQKFKTDSAATALDDRFQLFTEKIMPQYKDQVMTGVLVYVPSYFDYVRIRNYLKQSDYNFVQICEYSKVKSEVCINLMLLKFFTVQNLIF